MNQLTITAIIFIAVTLLCVVVIVWLVYRLNNEHVLRITAEQQSKDNTKLYERELATIKDSQSSLLASQQQQFDATMKNQKEVFEQQIENLKQTLQNLNNEQLNSSTTQLKNTNRDEMQQLIKPLIESFDALKRTMKETELADTERAATLTEAIKMMHEQTKLVGNTADSLAQALKGENKIQGNWGEAILENILQQEKLEKGKDYDAQQVLRDSNGNIIKHDDTDKRLIPDVILHYPDGRDLIIDSKVSLKAFVDYYNTDDETLKKQHLKAHVDSIRKHYKELSEKNYNKYIQPPRTGGEYVIMFIPNESALRLALQYEPGLWTEAFEAKVFIADRQNLLLCLRMFKLAWLQQQRIDNEEEIFKAAQQVLDRITNTIESITDAKKAIDKAQNAINIVDNRLRSQRESVVQAGKRLIDLGARTSQKKIYPPLLEE